MEGTDSLALRIGHGDVLRVDTAKVSKRSGRNNVSEVLGLLSRNVDLHEGEKGRGALWVPGHLREQLAWRPINLSDGRDTRIYRRLGGQRGKHLVGKNMAAAFEGVPRGTPGIVEFKRPKDGLQVDV